MDNLALLPSRAAVVAMLVFLVVAGGCTQQPAAPAPAPAPEIKTGVLVNVTSGQDDLHAVSMGLGLAKTAAERGIPVVVFLNVAAPIFASTALPADTGYEDFPPVVELLKAIMAGGGKVFVCEHCAKVTGVDLSTLLPGVAVSKHGSLLDELTPGMVGFSY